MVSADSGFLPLPQGGWRNGSRARFRPVCPKGREGSNPSSPTCSTWRGRLVRLMALLSGLSFLC
jgi:hypothetical protein